MHLPTGIVTRLVQEAPAAAAQTAQDAAAPYDSIWAADGGSGASSAFEQVMLSNDKLFVVLGVVLIIWIGLIMLLIRTDRRLAWLEREVEKNIPQEDPLGPNSGTTAGATAGTTAGATAGKTAGIDAGADADPTTPSADGTLP